MDWPAMTYHEQQELWNTLEILMHGKTGSEVRCAQQRLETLAARQRPYLAASARTCLDQLIQAAICASQGGEQHFYWLAEVDKRWQALTLTFDRQAKRSHEKGPSQHLEPTVPGAARAVQ